MAVTAEKSNEFIVMLAEDNEDDYYLTKVVFEKYLCQNNLVRTEDGEDLMDYLLHRGNYKDTKKFPLPDIILLDLYMPRKDGIQALKEIKADPTLKAIPIIVLTSSNDPKEQAACYALGANSFIRKPVNLDKFMEALKIFGEYWFKIVRMSSNK